MTVRTLFFASYRDLVGTGEVAVPLPLAATVADLVAALRARGDGWARLPVTPVVAVNLTYAPLDTVLTEGDEVALIPPVSGG